MVELLWYTFYILFTRRGIITNILLCFKTSHGIEDGNFVTRERWDHDGKEKHFKIIRKIIDDQIVCVGFFPIINDLIIVEFKTCFFFVQYNYVDDVILVQTYVRIEK